MHVLIMKLVYYNSINVALEKTIQCINYIYENITFFKYTCKNPTYFHRLKLIYNILPIYITNGNTRYIGTYIGVS